MKEFMMDLTDTGTRYELYRELVDLWEAALIILNRQMETSPTSEEKAQKLELEAGIHMLTRQIDIMANIDTKKYTLAREVDAIPKNPENVGKIDKMSELFMYPETLPKKSGGSGPTCDDCKDCDGDICAGA